MSTRVHALVLALLMFAGSSVAEEVPLLFPGSEFKKWETEELADGVYAFRYTFYRTVFVVTDEGVMTSDPLNGEAAAIMQREIRKVTDQPVKYVSYSHSHWDHASGGQIFKDEGAQIVAQEICAENLRESPNAEVVMPDITYDDHYRIELGDKALEMFYFGPAHDNCMVATVIRPANLLFLVDVANPPDGWLMFYNPGVSEDRVWNMVQFFDGVQTLIDRWDIETVIGAHMNGVPGDGPGGMTMLAATTGPSTVVAQRRAFWNGLIETTKAEIAAGTPADQVPDVLVEREALADQIIGYDPDKMRILLRRITSYVRTGE